MAEVQVLVVDIYGLLSKQPIAMALFLLRNDCQGKPMDTSRC